MKTKPPLNLKLLSVRVPEEVHRALKIRAAEDGRSVAVIVEGLIRQFLVWKNEVGDKSPYAAWMKKNFPEGNFKAFPKGTFETWGKMVEENPDNIKRIFPGIKKEKKRKEVRP